MEERMIILENMMNARVSVKKPQYGVNRVWNKRGQKMALPFGIVEQLLWDTGFSNMIKNGVLYIDNLQDKIDLGLEPADATEPTNIIVLSEEKMKNLWKNAPISVFKKEVSDLTKTQVDNLISFAIENKIVYTEKCSFIKQLTGGKDILLAISRQEDMEEEDRREQVAFKNEGRR